MSKGKNQFHFSEFWDNVRLEREFEESNLQCCTRVVSLHRCGYVALPKDHPLFGKKCSELEWIDVDGGVTFADGTDDMWVLGWDAAHSWHILDLSLINENNKAEYEARRNLYKHGLYMIDADMAERETRRFARQLAHMYETDDEND